MAENLDETLAQMIEAMRQYGPADSGIQIEDAQNIRFEAIKSYRYDPFDTQAEYTWRAASLLCAGLLAVQGDWDRATQVLDPNPIDLPSDFRLPALSLQRATLAGLMSVGKAVTCIRNNKPNQALWSALAAIDQLQVVQQDARYDRWRGVATLISVKTSMDIEGQRKQYSPALALLDEQTQPEAYALALYYDGRGNGRVRRSWRSATYQPPECMYYFNE